MTQEVQNFKSKCLDKFTILARQLADLRQLSYPLVVVLVVVVRQLTASRQLSYPLVVVLVVTRIEEVMVAVISYAEMFSVTPILPSHPFTHGIVNQAVRQRRHHN